MIYSPKRVTFTYPIAFDAVVVNLVDAGNVSLAGAEIAVLPIVDGAYSIELALHALTPDSYPALAGVPLRAKVQVKFSGGETSAPGFSPEFVFVIDPPSDVQVEN